MALQEKRTRTGALVVLVATVNLVGNSLLLGSHVVVVLASVEQSGDASRLELLNVLGELEQRRVGSDGDRDGLLVNQVDDVAASKAVTSSSKSGDALSLQGCDGFVERRTSLVVAVAAEPLAQVKIGVVETSLGNSVAVEVCRKKG